MSSTYHLQYTSRRTEKWISRCLSELRSRITFSLAGKHHEKKGKKNYWRESLIALLRETRFSRSTETVSKGLCQSMWRVAPPSPKLVTDVEWFFNNIQNSTCKYWGLMKLLCFLFLSIVGFVSCQSQGLTAVMSTIGSLPMFQPFLTSSGKTSTKQMSNIESCRLSLTLWRSCVSTCVRVWWDRRDKTIGDFEEGQKTISESTIFGNMTHNVFEQRAPHNISIKALERVSSKTWSSSDDFWDAARSG